MIDREHGIPQRTVSRVLRFVKFHPYHIVLTQQLQARDFNRRLQFCNWARNQYQRDPYFFMYVLFTDEATFSNRGGLNRHNCHYWSNHNPHWQRNVEYQYEWSINVWGGIIGTHVIGPYFFDGHLNRETYLRFLQNELPNLLENVNLSRCRMWLQQDGAPAHRGRLTTTYLNEKFHRWIGIGSRTQEWPARSDLMPMDFFLWGYVKEKVCDTTYNYRRHEIANSTRFPRYHWRYTAKSRKQFSITRDAMYRTKWRCVWALAIRICVGVSHVNKAPQIVRGKGTHVNKAPQIVRGKGTYVNKAPQIVE